MPELCERQRPRVLHVTSALDPGGIETWLLRLVEHPSDARLVTAVLVLGMHDGLLAPRFRDLGVQLLRVEPRGNWLRFVHRVATVMKASGPWDIVHSHVHRRSALVQMVATRLGIPLRISHSHNAHGQDDSYPWWLRSPARFAATMAIRMLSHQRLACSVKAAESLFGKSTVRGGHFVHMPYGLDEERFLKSGNLPSNSSSSEFRTQLGIPEQAKVVGHIGRFMPQKNHECLLRTAAAAIRHRPDLHFLLVGEGPLRPDMERLAEELGIRSSVTFAGHRLDVSRVLLHGMDCFFFPSRWEGLGIVLVEAQVAGLPCFLSDCVPPEANVFPERNRRFALDTPPDRTAKALVELLDRACALDRADTTNEFACKPSLPAQYQIAHNAALLSAVYAEAPPRILPSQEVQGDERPA